MESKPSQLHIFFIPHLAYGHMNPMLDIARLFALRGVKSTIITTPLNASNMSSKVTHIRNSGLDINLVTIPFPCEEVGLPQGSENVDCVISTDTQLSFFDGMAMLQPHVEKLVQEMLPNCIVSDTFLYWTLDVARKHGIPRIAFQVASIIYSCIWDSLQRHSLPQAHESDTEPFSVPGLPDEIKMTKSQTFDFVAFGHKRYQEMEDQMRENEKASDGVLINSFYELEKEYAQHYRKVMGYKAWYIGPVSLSNTNITEKAQRGKKAAIDEQYCLNWLSTKDPDSVIYVSFGSCSFFSGAQWIEIAHGLEASGVPFIWVIRPMKNKEEKCLPDGFEERIQGKGLVLKGWAPQLLILDHPAVGGFLTHSGWNSTLESVSLGVPMITWPLFTDQFANEILITEVLKIGVKAGAKGNTWFHPGDVSVKRERIEKVVSEVIKNGEEMRKRAKEFKEMAKRAIEEGGSSYSDLTALIGELPQLCAAAAAAAIKPCMN